MFEVLIFDFDGTLLDTAPDVHKCCNHALVQMNIEPISLNQAKLAIGPGPDNFALRTVGKKNLHRLDEFIRLFRLCYGKHCLDNTNLFPGVDEMLQQLDEYKLAIASNKPNVYTISILEGLDQRSRFDLIIGPEDVDQLKPHPEMLHHAIDVLGGHPDTAIMIGDTDNDVLAAHAANVVSCAVGWGYAPRDQLMETNPDYFINSPLDLVEIVKNGKIS